MYKIGEFSKITSLTVKTLRYYDEQGILQPSSRAENDYRLYNENDFEKAEFIVFLRRLEFSIAEIKDTLANCDSREDIQYYLKEKRELIENHIKNQKELIKKIDTYLLPENKEVCGMHYEFTVKEFESVRAATIRFKGSYSEVSKYFGTIYKEVKGKSDGAPFCCYYEDEYKEMAEIELCVPTKGSVAGKDITSKIIPRQKMLCTIHKGSYETLNRAYKAVLDYAKEKGIECGLPSREIYHKGPGMIFRGNPDKYITEIAIPVVNGGDANES